VFCCRGTVENVANRLRRERSERRLRREQRRYEKTVVLSHLYIKCIILPRQARDKHREHSKTTTVFLIGSRVLAHRVVVVDLMAAAMTGQGRVGGYWLRGAMIARTAVGMMSRLGSRGEDGRRVGWMMGTRAVLARRQMMRTRAAQRRLRRLRRRRRARRYGCRYRLAPPRSPHLTLCLVPHPLRAFAFAKFRACAPRPSPPRTAPARLPLNFSPPRLRQMWGDPGGVAPPGRGAASSAK
jgi:hypothetical protein